MADEQAAKKDRDETRRLCYMVLAASRTKKYDLVGTLTNALAHHSGLSDDPYALLDDLIDLVEGGTGAEQAATAVRELIIKLTMPPDAG